MERDRSGRRDYRGYGQSCELQHGNHELPPDLRFGESHGHDQIQSIDNKRLTETAAAGNLWGQLHVVSRGTRHTGSLWSGVNIHGLVLG